MRKKRVLIVDDSKDLLFLLQHSVKRLGPDFEVSTATDGASAIELIRKQQFDLVLTDYMMPKMTGMELAEEVRRISPDTQVVLMTAHDSTTLRDRVEDMALGGYVGKPFSMPEILEMVQRIVAQARQPSPAESAKPSVTRPDIYDHLKTLHNKTGAHIVLLLNTDGRPIQVVGQNDPAKVSRLAAFVAANFLSVTELATLLGDHTSVFKSSYHEGSDYNIYCHVVSGEYLLAVVFGAAGKPGTVWFYTKQTAAALAVLLGRPGKESAAGGDEEAVADEFRNLFEDGGRARG